MFAMRHPVMPVVFIDFDQKVSQCYEYIDWNVTATMNYGLATQVLLIVLEVAVLLRPSTNSRQFDPLRQATAFCSE